MYSPQTAALYASLGVEGTTYQVSFDAVLAKLNSLQSLKVLDFGCGAGRSTRLLHSLGPAHLIGVDHNTAMIEEARKAASDTLAFLPLAEGPTSLPFAAKSFDAVFAFHVYPEFPNYETMRQATEEVFRVTKPGGQFYVITTNPASCGADFVSYHYDAKEDLRDGDLVSCHVHTTPPFALDDRLWFLESCEAAFRAAGFEIRERALPLAQGNGWRDETKIAPDVVYALYRPA